ncbi:MAG: GTPase [Candidatus Hodgkinia cicadicola]
MASKLPCAIAITRISGNLALRVLALISNKLVCANKACVLKIQANKRAYDCIATWRPCPNSPTGEDYAEISVVGAAAVVSDLINALVKLSLTQAQRGEFTSKAIAHNKLSVGDAFKLAKTFGISCNVRETTNLTRQIDKLITELETQHNLGVGFKLKVYKLKALLSKAKHLKASSLLRACVIGKTNSGKSSLTNAITRTRCSIVNSLQGTTRDAVCARLRGLELVDTAGLKRPENKTELLALLATYNAADSAAVVMLLHTASDTSNFIRCKSLCAVIQVVSKSDLVHRAGEFSKQAFVSAYTLEGIASLRQQLRQATKAASSVNVICNSALARTILLLTRCVLAMDIITQIELLNKAKTALTRAVAEPKIDRILSQFCVGK